MNTDYILTHTPAQIAADNPISAIKEAFDEYVILEFCDPDTLFGGVSPLDGANEIADPDWSEQLLREWYDECDKPRPGTAEQLTLAIQLHTALYIEMNE